MKPSVLLIPVLSIFIAATFATGAPPAVSPSGTVLEIIDGDTLRVSFEGGEKTLHLWGIDAPELEQKWGPQAKALLTELAEDQEVSWKERTNRGGPSSARVFVDGHDLAATMTENGLAWLAESGGSTDSYATKIFIARASSIGMWIDGEDDLVHPAIYLAEKNRLPPPPTPTPIPRTISDIATKYDILDSESNGSGSGVKISNTSVRPENFSLPDSKYARCVVHRVRRIKVLVEQAQGKTSGLKAATTREREDKLIEHGNKIWTLATAVTKCYHRDFNLKGKGKLDRAMKLYIAATPHLDDNPKRAWVLFGEADEMLEKARLEFAESIAKKNKKTADSHAGKDPFSGRYP